MASPITCGLVAILCLALAVVLMSGHGSGLIAGFITMTPEERARFDERKIGRSVGLLALGCAVFAGVMAGVTFGGELGELSSAAVSTVGGVGSLVVLAAIGVTVWYANTRCLR